MKKVLFIILVFVASLSLKAQDISIGNQGALLYDCSSNSQFYDSGGSSASYTAGESFVLTICPNPPLPGGTPVAFEFVTSNFGHPNDFLAFYDGAGTVAPTDLIYSFSQTSGQSVGSTYRTSLTNASGCITVQFFSDGTSPGGDFEFNILCLPACKTVVANQPTSSIPVQSAEPAYIHSCLTDPITFTGSGTYDNNQIGYTQSDASSTFIWDFGSAGYDTGMVVSQSFEPGIYPVKLIVIDAAGCQSLNEINLNVRQTLVPDVRFFPEDTTVCLEDELEVSAYLVTTSGDILFVGDTAVFDTLKVQTSVSIQDTSYLPDDSDGITGNGITTPAVFEFPIYGYQPGATLQNVNDLFFVCIDIEHSFIGDLDIILECPNGQTVTLVDFNPPGNALGNNFGEPIQNLNPGEYGIPYTYCWSPAANPSDSIAQGNAGLVVLPNGAIDTSIQYYPTGNNWVDLIGCPLNGDWTIQVFDDYGSDDGYVFGAAIEFDGSFALNPDTFLVAYDNALWNANTQIQSALNNDSIMIEAIFNPFQPLTFNFTDNLGCSWSTDYDGVNVSTVEVNNVFKDTTICSADTLMITANTQSSASTCDYTIEMSDDFGDGWNGNIVNVFADGVLIGTFDIDFTEATFSAENFAVTNGQFLEFEYDNTNGSFNNEVSFEIKDADGNVIYSSGLDPNAGILFTTTADCLSGNTYVWGPTVEIVSTQANTATVFPTTNSTYWVEVTNEFGCSDTDTSTVVFDGTNTPNIDFSQLPVEFCCSGTELDVNVNNFVTGPSIDQIYINGVSSASNSFTVNSEDFVSDSVPLVYVIEVLAQNGCTASETIEMNRHCIDPSISVVDTIYVGDSQLFSSSVTPYDSMSYAWSTTDDSEAAITDPTAQNAEYNGIYENPYNAGLEVTAYFNQNDNTVLECVESAEMMPYEVVDILDLRYPNAFTPNNDNLNNVFRPIMSEYGEIVDFRVYNRWGDIVYDMSKSENKEGWDGTHNGKDQPNDVYIYYISVKNFDEVITKEGTVTLLR